MAGLVIHQLNAKKLPYLNRCPIRTKGSQACFGSYPVLVIIRHYNGKPVLTLVSISFADRIMLSLPGSDVEFQRLIAMLRAGVISLERKFIVATGIGFPLR